MRWSQYALRLGSIRRAVLSETFRELGNLSAAALVLGRMVGERPFLPGILLVGALMLVTLVGLSLHYAGDD